MLIVISVIFVLSWVHSSRKFFHVAREIFNVPAFSAMTMGHLTNMVLQSTVVLGYWQNRQAGVYILGRIWLLAHASQQFVRMLFIQPRNENAEDVD